VPTKKPLQDLIDDTGEQGEGVLSGDEKICHALVRLHVYVGSLEKWKPFNSNLAVMEQVFEFLVNKSSKWRGAIALNQYSESQRLGGPLIALGSIG